MIGTWIDEGLEYFDVARGIKPDSKILWQVRFGRITWVNYDLRSDRLPRRLLFNRAGYIPLCSYARWTKRENSRKKIGCSAEYFAVSTWV